LDRPVDDSYSGFQTDVYWFATTPEDVRAAREHAERWLNELSAAHEKTFRFPVEKLPSGFLASLVKRFPHSMPFIVIDWDRIGERDKFVATHLTGAIDASGGDAPAMTTLRPVAVLGVSSVNEILDEHAVPLLMDSTNGRLYMCEVRERRELRWIGHGYALMFLIHVYATG
jgi:hypothetical protein